ncbi:MAG: MBL fold metallo-hydrolase [Saprospiraceae bacterium]|nr:MBL fold metallo-hydrolase [Saprospiraceae bacterium]
MTKVQCFTFNPFQENTYVVYDETKECVIFDPGNINVKEDKILSAFIEKEQLNVVQLINTHCHLDHVFGNQYVVEKYKVEFSMHKGEVPVLNSFIPTCQLYGIPIKVPSPNPTKFIEHQDVISFGNTQMLALLTPGHSPASLSFYCEASGFIISGDVLFRESIGRTDLPGGNFDTLVNSINTHLFTLPNQTIVYSGHGPTTTIGYEKENNPFLT